jgi:hypothetical protein
VIADIRNKGSTPNTCTRPSEGFQQEVAETYKETNGKNTDIQVRTMHVPWALSLPNFGHQMTRIDENHEAIAQIRMTIVNCAPTASQSEYDSESEETIGNRISKISLDASSATLGNETSVVPEHEHYTFGSPIRKISTSHVLEAAQVGEGDEHFVHFDRKLRDHLRERGIGRIDQHTCIKVGTQLLMTSHRPLNPLNLNCISDTALPTPLYPIPINGRLEIRARLSQE